MDFDFTPYFAKYEALVEMVDGVFAKVKEEHPDRVKCKTGCCDCCFALFDLTLIEAIYINHAFNSAFGRDEQMLEKANRVDRQIYKLKKRIYREHKDGKNEVEIFAMVGRERIRCPLLNDKDLCDLYDKRPITCRVYGIPTAIQGMTHTCGTSGFEEGGKYPTVNMDTIYRQLYSISQEIVTDIKTRYTRMADMLVPVSMAILTDYDDRFFGFADDDEQDDMDAQDGKGPRKGV